MPCSVAGIKLTTPRHTFNSIQTACTVSRFHQRGTQASPSWIPDPQTCKNPTGSEGSWIHQKEEISVPSWNRNENWISCLLDCETMEGFCRRPFSCKTETIWIPVSLIRREWSRKLPTQKNPCWVLKDCCWMKRCWDSWPPEEKNSIWGQRWGLIAQSFCVIKFC